MQLVGALLTLLVVLGTLPVLAGAYQFLVLALSVFATHLEKTRIHLPRVAILIPAWNEGMVIGATIDRLMQLEYPPDRLRIYVIDDASTDETPEETIRRNKKWPKNVFHVRRVAGGEGKAHTLNYGLAQLWQNDWTEAVLIMDADVIYTASSLRRMARHLVDPEIGAVTAYIKEGSRSPSLVQRFITFEYITATGASRRAQNVMGFLACLSGGAQLHSRENLLAIGGAIFDDTLAEDTFTTFNTQLEGRKAIFEPNALVYAEEPDTLRMLWKQRLRWARGNVQITQVFANLWFNGVKHESLGSTAMAVLWFSIFLMPVFQIGTAIGLLGLYAIDPAWAWELFRAYWIVASLVYLLVTFASYVIDWESARKSWFEGVMFPGVISLIVIVYALVPPLFDSWLVFVPAPSWAKATLVLFLYLWTALAMPVSYLAMLAEDHGHMRLSKALLYLAGYGPFLCAVTFGAYVKEWQGADKTWDKTVKTGKVG
ncbi:MAG: glycosyltransferase family 2 protein [Deltaproteobacteria bacterium]|nr:glycosyltransferase family 2 protein [Deltaproteobacteria bacterium]